MRTLFMTLLIGFLGGQALALPNKIVCQDKEGKGFVLNFQKAQLNVAFWLTDSPNDISVLDYDLSQIKEQTRLNGYWDLYAHNESISVYLTGENPNADTWFGHAEAANQTFLVNCRSEKPKWDCTGRRICCDENGCS